MKTFDTIEEIKDLFYYNYNEIEVPTKQRLELKAILEDHNFHVGRTWKTAKKDLLLPLAYAVDGETGNAPNYENGDCIIDFEGKFYSVSGRLVDGEIVIEDDEIIYDPAQGIVVRTPQERWDEKNNMVSKSYKLNKDLVSDFADACKKEKISATKQLSKMMSDFILDSHLKHLEVDGK